MATNGWIIERTVDLAHPPKTLRNEQPYEIAYTGDMANPVWTVHVLQDGQPMALGGSVKAYIRRIDGAEVISNGTISGNTVTVELGGSNFGQPGYTWGILRYTDSTTNATITLDALTMMVQADPEGTSVLDPDDMLPTLQELLAELDDMRDATAAAEAAVSFIADEYSSSSTYAVGDYAIHSGSLYRCTTAIASAETWDDAHWTQVVFGDEVRDLKSALDDISVIESDNLLHLLNKTQTINGVTVTTDKGNNVVLNGTATSNGGRLFFFSDPFTLPAGTYAIGQVITDSTSQPMFNKFVVNVTKTSDSSSIASAASSAIPPTPASFTLAENTEIAVGFSVLSGNTYDNTKCAVMLNAGSTILPYEPPNRRVPKYEDTILSAFNEGGIVSANLSEYRTEMRRYLINTSFHPTDLPDDSVNYANLIVFPNQPSAGFSGQFLIDGNSNMYYRVIRMDNGSVTYVWRIISWRYGDYTNALTGKLWYACGDSFTQGDFTGTETPTIGGNGRYRNQKPTYPYWIGTRNDISVSLSFAVNGATLAKRTDGSTGYEFCEHYTDVSASADYITLYFGINDSYRTTLGTPADTTKNTFYGALDLILKYYTENRPNTKIGIIATNAGNPNTISGYIEAVKTVAARYGVPCLDMNSTDHMLVISSNNPNVSASAKETALTKYRVAEGNNHPNALCHKLQSNFIEEWLLTL